MYRPIEPHLIDTLADALEAYEAARAAYGNLENAEPKAPDVPDDGITAQEDYDLYCDMIDQYNTNRKTWLQARSNAAKALSDAKHALLKALPVKNVWIRVGDKAVGCYLDTNTGEVHLKIREWSLPDLPKINDR